jgi:8-amino-7-oxononanoate synthase
MPLADRIAQEELAALRAQGLEREPEALEGAPGPVVRIGGVELLNLCANDYLGLAADPALAEAAIRGAREGTGAGASRLITGTLPAHAELEAALASHAGSEAAVLFNSGYGANLGVLQALVGEGDAVFSDALNHASLIDGARLSRAQVHVYPHLDLGALDRALAASPARRKLVATDTVFSMDGDLAPLPELCDLCARHGAMLVVDEAHATGVFGARGSGLAEHLGCAARIDVRVGTLSKAAGSFGAYAAGSRAVCALLVNRARSYVFTTALPPSVCRASLAALELLHAPERRARLWRNIERFAAGLRALDVPAEPRSAIFPVLLGAPERALEVAAALRARRVLAKAIRPPTVPAGTSRLRLALSAAHTDAQLDLALDALGRALGRIR